MSDPVGEWKAQQALDLEIKQKDSSLVWVRGSDWKEYRVKVPEN